VLDPGLFGPKLRAALTNNETSPLFEWIDGALQVSNDEGVTFTPIVGLGSPDPWLAKYSAQAQQLTGVTDESLELVLDENFRKPVLPYGTPNITASTFQSRSGGTIAVQPSGCWRIVGGSSQQGGLVRISTVGALFPNQAATRFLAVFKFRLATNLPNSNSRIYFMIGTPGSCEIGAGINAPNSGTAKWGFSCNSRDAGNAPKLDVLSTRAPVVGQMNTAIVAYDGEFVWGSFNGEPYVQVADSSKMVVTGTSEYFFDSFPSGGTQADNVDLRRATLWAVA